MRQSILVAIGLCLWSRGVRAQGSLFTLGIGTGSGTIMCSACTHAGNMGGSTVTLQFAPRVNEHLRVGSTADWWWHSRDTWERGVWNLEAELLYYPWTVRRGFYVGAGPTYTLILATVTESTALQRHGWGVAAEIGYDIAPRAAVSLTPRLSYSYGWVGDIYYPLGSGIPFAKGWKHEVLALGLGLTLHEGRRQ